MTTYDFRIPPLVVIGGDAFQRAGVEAKRLGGKRALLVTDDNLLHLGHVQMVQCELQDQGLSVVVYPEVNSEPTVEHIENGLALLRQEECDIVVSVGGGSPIDTGKAIALMATNTGSIKDYVGMDKFKHPKLPLIAVPTTAGTGSEVTRFIIVTDTATNVKMLIGSPLAISDVALVDYKLTVTMPASVTASTGLDALTHALEAFISRRANPLSDNLALAAINHILPHLRRAWANPEDAQARAWVMQGSTEAGMAFSNSSVALVHGMARPIGAYFHIPHGLSNAMLLPAVMRFSHAAAADRLARVAEVVGVQRGGIIESALSVVEEVEGICRDLEVPSLSGAGIDRDRLLHFAPTMARDAIASGSPGNNPRLASEEEIVELYCQCL